MTNLEYLAAWYGPVEVHYVSLNDPEPFTVTCPNWRTKVPKGAQQSFVLHAHAESGEDAAREIIQMLYNYEPIP